MLAISIHLIIRGGYRVLSLLAFLNALPLAAQEYIAKVEHYGVEQGLSHRQVNAIFQDSRGFVWLGTPNGLNRFDGYSFRQYTKEKSGLRFNYIQEISEDADGWLWLVEQEQKSICLFHPDRGEVLTLEEKFGKTDSLFARRRFGYRILNDENGAIWLPATVGDTLFRYHPSSGVQAISVEGPPGKIYPIRFSDRKTLWVSRYRDRIEELSLEGKVLQCYENAWLYGNWALTDNSMLLITRKAQGTEQLVLFDLEHRILPHLPVVGHPPPHPAFVLPFDDKGRFVVHDRLVDAQGRTLAQWEFAQHDRNNFMWRGYLLDRTGRYWLGDDFGFYILQIRQNRFSHLFYQKEAKPGLGNSIRGIVATPEKVYANLESFGLFEHDKRNRLTRSIRSTKIGWGHYALTLSKNGELLSGTRNAFFRLKPDGPVFEKIQTGFDVWSFYEDDSGTLWLGSSTDGLHILPPGASTPIPFVRYNGFDALASAFVLHIGQDAAGLLWVCAGNGFYKVHPQKGVIARYWSGGKGEYFLPAEYFLHAHLDADNVFWLATSTGLLRVASLPDNDGTSRRLRWDEQSGKWYNRSNWLSNDFIYAVYEDKTGRLWLPTDYGIICLNKKTEAVKTYFVSDGLTDPEFNRKAHFQAPDGTLYFGGLNGINVFNPADFPEVTETQAGIPLVFTAFQQFDGKRNRLSDRTYELLQNPEIRLCPEDRFFNIELALLSFNEPELVQYAWKIDDLDEGWHFQKERLINFGGLPYGAHTLRIKAQAPDGQGSEKELTFTVRVLRPWYLQTWFLALAALLLGLSVRSYIHWRNRQHFLEQKKLEGMVDKATARIEQDKQTIEKQAEALRQLDKVKSRFFANVSHELRTPLTLMLGPISSMLKSGELSNRNFTYAKLAQQNGSQLLNLVGEILDLQKLESGKLELHPKPVLLYPFLKRIAAQFESFAQNKSIAFVFLYRAEKRLQIEADTAKLELVLNNLLSNAMKFTEAGGRVEFKVEDLAHSIRLTVSDTGRGIHADDLPRVFERFFQSHQADTPSEGGTGIGLALVKELSVLFDGSVHVQSPGADGKGSAFLFEFPKVEVMGAAEPSVETTPELSENSFAALTGTAQGDAANPTVLLVEDNADLRTFLQVLLAEKYQIVVAENGQQALERLANGAAPAIIISDIMMPRMDGFQLLERLKSADQYRHIPVIMLTARADMQDKLRALRIGVDDYLLKPFEEEELLTRVENLLLRQQNRYSQNPDEKDKTAAGPCISEADSKWLSELELWAQENLQNEFLNVSTMAHQVSMSERQLLRRLRELTGLSPQQYIAEIRLQKARDLLERGAVRTVAEAAYAAGFSHPKVFSRTYRARFGRLPSTYF